MGIQASARERVEKSRSESVIRGVTEAASESGRPADVAYGISEWLATPKQEYRDVATYNKYGKRMGSETVRLTKTHVGAKVTSALGKVSAATDVAGLASTVSEYNARATALGEGHPYTFEAQREGQIQSVATAIGAAASLLNPAVGVGVKIFLQEMMMGKEEQVRRKPEYREYLHRYNQWLEYRSTIQPISLPNDESCSIHGNLSDPPSAGDLIDANRYSDRPTIRPQYFDCLTIGVCLCSMVASGYVFSRSRGEQVHCA